MDNGPTTETKKSQIVRGFMLKRFAQNFEAQIMEDTIWSVF